MPTITNQGLGSKTLSLCLSKLAIDQIYRYPWHTKSVATAFAAASAGCLEGDHDNVLNILRVCLTGHTSLNVIRYTSDHTSLSSFCILCRFFSTSFLQVLVFPQGMPTLDSFIGQLYVPSSLK